MFSHSLLSSYCYYLLSLVENAHCIEKASEQTNLRQRGHARITYYFIYYYLITCMHAQVHLVLLCDCLSVTAALICLCNTIPAVMAAFEHTIESSVRGFHVYKAIWTPTVNEQLKTDRNTISGR